MNRFVTFGAFVVVGAALVGCHASAGIDAPSSTDTSSTSSKEVHTKVVRDANGNIISKESSNSTMNP